MISTLKWSAASQWAMWEAGLKCLTGFVAKSSSAVIASQRGSADPEVEAMVAAGWTLSPFTWYIAGKRIRHLDPPK